MEPPPVPLDGDLEPEEPTPVLDGIPDLNKEIRSAEDIAAFEKPPAGYNPYLFQIELDPLLDRRPAELFRLEPYVARGVRMGGFVIFPEAEIGGIATNNLFRSDTKRSDSALEVGGSVRAVSDWRVHAMELRASGLTSFYDEFPSENDRSYALEARGRVDVRRGSNVEALVSRQVDRDVRSARDAPANAAERGEVETTRAAMAINQRFNRLGLQLRGSVTDIAYAPVPSIGGGPISNDDRDFTQREVALRTSWALSCSVEVFAETAVNDREFHAAPLDGSCVPRPASGTAVALRSRPLVPLCAGK